MRRPRVELAGEVALRLEHCKRLVRAAVEVKRIGAPDRFPRLERGAVVRGCSPSVSSANSGNVHILVMAPRAEFAGIVHIPGMPEFKAINRSRHSC